MTNHESTRERLEVLRSGNPEIWTVSDDERVVQASVDLDGKLEVLRLAPQWWRTVSADEVGPLIMGLLRASTASRNQTIVELEEETPAAPADESAATAETSEPQDRSDITARLGNLLAAFSELDHYRQSVETATRESAHLRSSSGNVTLELVGGGSSKPDHRPVQRPVHAGADSRFGDRRRVPGSGPLAR